MRRHTRIVALLSLALAWLGFTVLPAPADEHGIPDTVDELFEIYGIANEPGDYVVTVDTSGSMMNPPPIYPDVRSVFSGFVSAIGDADHLSVITFDTSPVIRFNGYMDAEGRAAAANALPETARGARTDIGAAINAALDRMERPDGAQVQTLIFLTDGRIDAPGSPYATRGSSAWVQLRERADRLSAGRSVSVYGAGLGGGVTDIEALRDVFPRANIVSLPNDQLAAFFDEAIQRAKLERLRLPVEEELRRNAVQAVATVDRLDDVSTLLIRFDSKLPHLGVTINLRGITVTDAAGAVLSSTLVGGPRTLTIGPGQSSEPAVVRVEVPGLAHEFRIGGATESRSFTVAVDAETEVEPSSILVGDLGIEARPDLVQPEFSAGSRGYGTPYWMFGVAAAGLALAVLIANWFYRRFVAIPRLRGGVELPDGTTHYFRGKKEQLPSSRIDFAGGGSSVDVFTKRGQFTKRISTSHPRLFVTLENGSAQVSTMGFPEEELAGTAVQVGHLDVLFIGPSRVTVVTRNRKGK